MRCSSRGRALWVMACSSGLAATTFALATHARPRKDGTSNAVGGLAASVVPEYPPAPAAYTVYFMPPAAVPAGGDIFLSESAGPTVRLPLHDLRLGPVMGRLRSRCDQERTAELPMKP
jgi:hypothetical protein